MLGKLFALFRSTLFTKQGPAKMPHCECANGQPAADRRSPRVQAYPRSIPPAPREPLQADPDENEMARCLFVLGRSTRATDYAIELASDAMSSVHPHDDAIRGRQAKAFELAKVLALASFVEVMSYEVSESFTGMCDLSRVNPDLDAATVKHATQEPLLRLHRAADALVDYAASIGGRSCVPPPPQEFLERTHLELDEEPDSAA